MEEYFTCDLCTCYAASILKLEQCFSFVDKDNCDNLLFKKSVGEKEDL